MPKFYLDTEEKGKGYIVGWMGRLQKTRDGQNNRKGGSATPPIEGDDFSFAASGAVVEPSILQVQKPSDRLGDFTVVRGSSATYVDSDGIIKEAFAVTGDELVTNGDFEDGSTGWSLGTGWSVADGQATSVSTGEFNTIDSIGILLVPGKLYSITYTADITGITSGRLLLNDFEGGESRAILQGTNTVILVCSFANFKINQGGATGTATIDNVSVKEVSYDMARIDYTNGVAELLTEPQSTNLFIQSGGSAVENTTVTATPYTVSFYGTGTLTFSGAYTGSLIGTGENERVSLTFTPTAGTLTSATSGTITYKQCENLAYATSVIITNGSTVTRLADQITDGGNVNVINSVEGTMFFEGSALFDDTGENRYLSLSDGTENNVINISYNTTGALIQFLINAGGALILSHAQPTVDITTNAKIAVKWKVNDFAIWINGVEVDTVLSGVVPTGLNSVNLSNAVGANYFNTRIKAIKVYDRALTDEELEQITTL